MKNASVFSGLLIDAIRHAYPSYYLAKRARGKLLRDHQKEGAACHEWGHVVTNYFEGLPLPRSVTINVPYCPDLGLKKRWQFKMAAGLVSYGENKETPLIISEADEPPLPSPAAIFEATVTYMGGAAAEVVTYETFNEKWVVNDWDCALMLVAGLAYRSSQPKLARAIFKAVGTGNISPDVRREVEAWTHTPSADMMQDFLKAAWLEAVRILTEHMDILASGSAELQARKHLNKAQLAEILPPVSNPV